MEKNMQKIKSFTELEVWKCAHALVLDAYKFTSTLPKVEKYGLISQMRRAAVSVPANIAEGFKRKGQNDKVHFYNIAQGSLEELRYYFILCNDLGYKIDERLNVEYGKKEKRGNHPRSTTYHILPTSLKEINTRIDQISCMLSSLINKVKETKYA